MSRPEPDRPTRRDTPDKLTVDRIEVIPIVAPLGPDLQWQLLQHERAGHGGDQGLHEARHLGEAYAGDEVDTLAKIVTVIEQ